MKTRRSLPGVLHGRILGTFARQIAWNGSVRESQMVVVVPRCAETVSSPCPMPRDSIAATFPAPMAQEWLSPSDNCSSAW